MLGRCERAIEREREGGEVRELEERKL